MSDDLNNILYGETQKVTLLDKKEYTIRELNLNDLSTLSFDSTMSEPKNVLKLAYSLLKQDHPNLSEKEIGRLISVRMMKEDSPFMTAVNHIMGVGGDKKNA